MQKQIVTIALLLLLLLCAASPFSALAALMLIVIGTLVYGLLVAVVKAFVAADVSQDR